MSYQLVFTPQPTYLHVVVTGTNTRESIEGYLAEVLRECQTHSHRRVLVEERLEGPALDHMEIFQIVSAGSERARGQFDTIAFVDVNARGSMMKYAEALAINRALPLKVFATVDQAKCWLEELPV